jgi:hypothetical protein
MHRVVSLVHGRVLRKGFNQQSAGAVSRVCEGGLLERPTPHASAHLPHVLV